MLETIIIIAVINIMIGIAIENRLRAFLNTNPGASPEHEEVSFNFPSFMFILFWALIIPIMFMAVLTGIIYRLIVRKIGGGS